MTQTDSYGRFIKEIYDAVIIDNDFVEGMVTLSKMLNVPDKKCNIAYISAYDLSGLSKQYERKIFESKRLGKVKTINPLDLDSLGVRLIQKRGKNISKEVSLKDLEDRLYDFLVKSA